MTKQTEGNKTLAVFMGMRKVDWFAESVMLAPYEHIDSTTLNSLTIKNYHGNAIAYTDNELKYNSSFDWLMPVWFKFRDIKGMPDKNLITLIAYKKDIATAITYSQDNTLSEAFNLLVSAITWYNTIKEK